MMEYRFATVSDIDALVQSRLEMLRVVNDLGDDYVFGEDFVQASRDYYLKGDQITVFLLFAFSSMFVCINPGRFVIPNRSYLRVG